MEWNDIYDENRNLTGRVHRRGNQWKPGEYGVVVCVWVYDGAGHLLLTRRAKGKSFAGTWENSGGAVKAGETSRQGAEREFREELGVSLDLGGLRPTVTVNFGGGFDDFFIVRRDLDDAAFQLQAEEVAAVRWVTLPELLAMVDEGSFIPYPKSFLGFLFDMRDSFGFPTK